MANRQCYRCGKQQSAFGPGVLIQEFNCQDYCEECLKIVKEENATVAGTTIKLADATTEQMLNILVINSGKQLALAKAQLEKQASLNRMMVFLLVIVTLGLILKACQG